MRQAEIKYSLVSKLFGDKTWKVIVDFDSQEKDRLKFIDKLEKDYGVITKGGKKHSTYMYTRLNRPDIYAEDKDNVYIIEVEGGEPRQKERNVYSVLGQITFSMIEDNLKSKKIYYGIAFPDDEMWISVLKKIPIINVKQKLGINLYLVDEAGKVRIIQPNQNL